MYIGDDTTQFYGDYDTPLPGSLLNNQYDVTYTFMASQPTRPPPETSTPLRNKGWIAGLIKGN